MNLKKGFRSLLSAQILLTIIGTLSLPIVVRVLGPGPYGDYAFLLSVFSMLMIPISAAVTEGIQKFVAEDREDSRWQERIVGFYFQLAVVLAVVGSVVVALVTWTGVVGRVFGSKFTPLFYFVAIYVVTGQLGSFSRHTLLGLQLEPFSEGFTVLRRAIRLVVGLGLAVVGFGVVGFLVGHIVASLVFTTGAFLVLRRELSLRNALWSRPDAVPVRSLLSFNGLNIVLVVLMQSMFHTDVLMIQFFAGSEQTGYYKVALVLAEYIWLVPIVLQRLMLHSASQLWSNERHDRIQAIASRLTRYVFLLTALLAIGIFVLADRFVPLYFGSNYEAAIGPLRFLLFGAFGFALARPIYGINQATGRLKPLIVALSVSTASNVGLNYLLIPQYGMTGAAIATSVSYGSMFVLQVVCARHLGYSPLEHLRPAKLLGTVALAGPVIVGFEYVIGSDLLALALVPPIGLLAFTAISLSLGAIDATEIHKVTAILPPSLERWVPSRFSESN